MKSPTRKTTSGWVRNAITMLAPTLKLKVV
jgi:hypothetical protein